MLAPMPVSTRPATMPPYVAERKEKQEPDANSANPARSPLRRPNRSDKGPQISTESPALREYPVKRWPISSDDLPTLARIAGRRGLTIWLSATPRKRTRKRHKTTRISSLDRRGIENLFEELDL